MSRVCSACGATVARKDCHRNRYAEHICRQCQAAGIKFTRRGQLRYLIKRPLAIILLMLVITSLVLLAMWTNLLTFESFSFFSGEHEVRIDTPNGASLNAPIEARRIESPSQSTPPPKNEKP